MRKRKLSFRQVAEIRRLYAARPTRRELALKFGVSPGLVAAVLDGKCYKDCLDGETGQLKLNFSKAGRSK